MADAIALIDDLFFQAKVRQTAQQIGVALEITSSGAQLAALAAANPQALVMIDLNARSGPLEALRALYSSVEDGGGNHPPVDSSGISTGPAGNPRRVIAFLSHVQAELAERARAMGCREVMPRSRFTQELSAILQSSKS